MRRRRIGAAWTALALFVSVVTVSPASPAVATDAVIDDFDDGDASDWGFFGGNGAGGGGGALDDRPFEGTHYLSTGWGGGGTASSFYGGAFKNFDDAAQVTPPADPWFSVWVLNQSDATVDSYNLEITLREDTNGDGWTDGTEDSIQLVTGFTAADFDDTWRRVSAPLSAFDDLGTGGDGTFNGNLDEVVIVIGGVVGGDGSVVEVDFDSFAFSAGGDPEPGPVVVDDFEMGLPSGTDGDGIPIGFFTFSDGSPVSIGTTGTPPVPTPGSTPNVLELTANVTAFAGFIHAFENDTVDTWVPQDWSSFEGMRLWFYGQNNGTTVFLDVLDNRAPGSTVDDAERFSVSFVDDFSGWQQIELPFDSFVRKEIGNGAPNDGFTLTQVHGWALGTLNTPGEVSYYIDDAELYGTAEIPDLAVTFARASTGIDEGATGSVAVKLNRPMNSDDPPQVSVDYVTEVASATPYRDYTPTSGTLTFVNGGPSELAFPVATLTDSKWEGSETVILRLTNPVDVDPGFATQAHVTIIDDDPYDPFLLDDFEKGAFKWDGSDNVTLSTPELGAGDALARPGQDPFEHVLQVDGPLAVDITIEGNACLQGNGVIPVHLLSTDTFDATAVDHATVTFGEATEFHRDRRSGAAARHVEDVNDDGSMDLVFHFRAAELGVDCEGPIPFNGATFDGQPITGGGSNASFTRDFPIGQDWSNGEALSFWYYGTGTGGDVTIDLKDNRAADPGPAGWDLVFAEEFEEPAGTPPNPAHWSYEIGDGTVNGIPGWGNDEFQYYTDSTDNVATDGNGNLVLTVRQADGSFECYYGPCEYTSARLVSKHKAEFAYGRIESRILVPDGESGLWPAFWSLGTDIDVVEWPQTGEIDFMEYVSRLPDEIFGTIHGPGYSGGQSYSSGPVSIDDGGYHTYAVEWQPDLIEWYLDGELFHTATPDVVQPNEWVFNDPVYLLLNVAIGGNFGGTISPDLELPASMSVDWVRVYQGPDTAERFEASFVDGFEGWQLVEVPFSAFTRSADQPAGAPNDGLTLDEVWGYGFSLPDGGLSGGTTWIDLSQVEEIPPPTAMTVTSMADSGPGSLRHALEVIAAEGTITFDPSLSGETIALTSGQLDITKSVTVDGSGAPGLTLSGSDISRVVRVATGVEVAMNDIVVAEGAGAPQGGGILNHGTLTLHRVMVTDNIESSTGGASFDLGGGGIYNGDGATLNLVDSTVSNNATIGQPGGGVYGFFNSTLNIIRSTVSGNVAGDVAGGIRALGTVNITNSTISDNTSTAWHGGAAFLTDGTTTILNSTITANNAPSGTTGGLFVGTFGPSAATLEIQSSIVADNGDFGCLQGFFGAGTVTLTSLGNNVFTDGACNPIGSDQVVSDAGLGSLADNGGPTLTHALLAGSPAIDAADAGTCPATDQRGVARPQGSGCDVGAYEAE